MTAPVTKLSDDQWIEVQKAYEAPGANITDIAKAYSISRKLVARRAQKFGWKKAPPPQPDDLKGAVFLAPVPSNVPGATDDDAVDTDQRLGFSPTLQTRVLRRQQREWRDLDHWFKRVMEPVFNKAWRPDGWGEKSGPPNETVRMKAAEGNATIYVKLVSGVASKQPREREAYSIDLAKFGGIDAVTLEMRSKAVNVSVNLLNAIKAAKAAGFQIEGVAEEVTS